MIGLKGQVRKTGWNTNAMVVGRREAVTAWRRGRLLASFAAVRRLAKRIEKRGIAVGRDQGRVESFVRVGIEAWDARGSRKAVFGVVGESRMVSRTYVGWLSERVESVTATAAAPSKQAQAQASISSSSSSTNNLLAHAATTIGLA